MKKREREMITIIGGAVYSLKWEETQEHWWSKWKTTKMIEKIFLGFDGKQL